MNQLTYFFKVFVPLVFVLCTIAILAYQYHKNDIFLEVVSEHQTSLSFKEEYMGDFFRSAIADLYYLSNSNIPYRIIDNNAYPENAIDDLTLFSQTARRYDQLRILDTTGMEIIRINYANEKPSLVKKKQLQDKAHRYYFKDLRKISSNQIYISPIDLNVELRKIEVPYKPVVRLISRIEKKQKLEGYLISNINLREFFDDLAEIKNEQAGQFMLLNNDGYWLFAPKEYTLFGFMKSSTKNEKFQHLYPKEWKKIRDEKQGYFRTSNGLYVFNKIAFKSIVENIPYLSENYLMFPEDNNFTLLIFISSDELKLLINKDFDALILTLIAIIIASGLLAFYQSNVKINQSKSKNLLEEKNENLQELIIQLESRNNQLREYSQIVSHDLRSPIANLNMLIQMHQEMEDPIE